MPLTPPTADRTLVHRRSIQLEGWKRMDGHWDIEARLVDTKNHDYPLASGMRPAGAPVHDMWVRVTIDRDLNIVGADACSDAVPYPDGCEHIAPAYREVVGLNLGRGFRKTVEEKFHKVHGCAHMTELLLLLPTAAVQTFASDMRDSEGMKPGEKPFQLDRCHALDTHSETVRRYYPRWHRGQKTG